MCVLSFYAIRYTCNVIGWLYVIMLIFLNVQNFKFCSDNSDAFDRLSRIRIAITRIACKYNFKYTLYLHVYLTYSNQYFYFLGLTELFECLLNRISIFTKPKGCHISN